MKKILLLLLAVYTFSSAQGQNNALHYDGVNDFVNFGNIGNVGGNLHLPNNFTLEAWVKLDNFPVGFPAVATILRNGTGPTDEQYSLLIDGNGGVQFFWVNGGVFLEIHTTTSITLNTWHHVAAVRESPTSVKLYIDCVDQPTVGSTVSAGASGGQVVSGIGIPSLNVFALQGAIDELRIWDMARSEAALGATKSCALSGNEANLVAYYDFNNGTASGANAGLTTLVDKTGNGNDGILNNFNLTGSTSNWVSGAPVSASCSPPPPRIPTMNQWGLIIFGLLILNLSIFYLWRAERIVE